MANKRKEIIYHSVRRYVKDGDVLMYKGHGLSSWLIKKITKSEYSHAGIAVRWNNRLMVLEAKRKPGIRVIPLSTSIAEYKGDIEWYTARSHMTNLQRMRLVQYAEQEIGKEYTTVLVTGNLFRAVFGATGTGTPDELEPTTKIFCSYYVAQAYNASGIDLAPNKHDRYTTPGDVANSKALIKKGILKHVPHY